MRTLAETGRANAAGIERVQQIAARVAAPTDPETVDPGPPAAERTTNVRIVRAAFAGFCANCEIEGCRSVDHTSLRQLSCFHFIDVAPHPGLSRLDGASQRMMLVMRMFGGVAVLGRIAATNLSAISTQAKMNPTISQLHALFTNMLVRFGDMQMTQVTAR